MKNVVNFYGYGKTDLEELIRRSDEYILNWSDSTDFERTYNKEWNFLKLTIYMEEK